MKPLKEVVSVKSKMFPAHLSKYSDSENINNNKKIIGKLKSTYRGEKIRRLYFLNCPPGGAVDHCNGADKLEHELTVNSTF